MKNICNMGLYAVTQCSARKYSQLCENSPETWGDWNTLQAPYSQLTLKCFFSNWKWLRHTNHNTTHNIHTYVHAMGRIRLGARKLPPHPKYKQYNQQEHSIITLSRTREHNPSGGSTGGEGCGSCNPPPPLGWPIMRLRASTNSKFYGVGPDPPQPLPSFKSGSGPEPAVCNDNMPSDLIKIEKRTINLLFKKVW